MTTTWLCGVVVSDASEHQVSVHCSGHPDTHGGVLLQFVRVSACGQKANESLEFLKSHSLVGPSAEITA